MHSDTAGEEVALSRRADGVWESSLPLDPGQYLYRFKVDGRWQLDPTNAEKTTEEEPRSILLVP